MEKTVGFKTVVFGAVMIMSTLVGIFFSSREAGAREIYRSDSKCIEISLLGGNDEFQFEDIRKNNASSAAYILGHKNNFGATFIIRGGADAVKKFRNRIARANKYGVLFKYDNIKQTKNYSWIRISNQNRKLYKTSIKLIKKIRKYYLKYYQNGYYYNREFDESDYVTEMSYNIDENGNYHFYDGTYEYMTYWNQGDGTYLYWDQDTQNFERVDMDEVQDEIDYVEAERRGIQIDKDYERYLYIKNTKFADLSSAMKVRILSTAFWCDTSKRKNGNPFIRYRYSTLSSWSTYVRYNQSGSDLTLLRRLKKGTAIAVCEGFSMYERTLYRQLGITTYYASTSNHAICVVKTKNSAGKTLWMFENYDDLVPSNGKIEVINGSKRAYKYVIRCSNAVRSIIHSNHWKNSDIN